VSTLDDLLARAAGLSLEDRTALARDAFVGTSQMRFVPNVGPQAQAYDCEADVLLYGGQAGGGKTYLELGWAINTADNGIIFRRERTQTDGLEREGKNLIGTEARFNGQDLEWTWPNGKTLKLAGMQLRDDWQAHAGRERDYMAFDEGGEFLEMQVASIMAWLRAPIGKRTRVIIGSNPPRTAEGLWLVKWFAPWLDPSFGNKAIPGELRWAIYVTRGDEPEMVWVDGPGEYQVADETYTAKSYTFIPASLADNPHRDTPEYRAQLQSLPEPLRSQLLYGKFTTSLKDVANQVIPTRWVQLAQERWTPEPPKGIPMCMVGVDASGGGDDPMVIACRYDSWFAPLVEVPGREIPMDRAGAHCAGIVISHRRDNADVTVDMSGGYGGPVYEHLKDNKLTVKAYKGAEATPRRTGDRKLGFTNKRSAAIWLLREALDPGQPGGSLMALPPDQKLLADLTAPTFEVTPRGIKVEPKEDVVKRLGRSTDRGDAVAMAHFEGPTWATQAMEWMDRKMVNGRMVKPPAVLISRQPLSAPRQPLSARSRQ